ncbi:GNAT family N-acetyltransferase [Nonlabens xiamenensis]|uniref:GNAT family N-acetyltransferase n=1 Tax=Nonlabens xiamenensis TaxID=2341043 RepID=UPI000F615C21|nr:GNAT family N-acetyltransferase [Nonlabens xiamenensis]
MKIQTKTFDELSTDLLYALLRLRAEVFVVEQDCVYQDIDNKDQKAIHILGFEDSDLVAYTRFFAPGIYFEQASIGRVVVRTQHRGKSYGKEIMEASIAFAKANSYNSIKISAQCYLDNFYKELGFIDTGERYLEDGIPHQAMTMELT